VWDAVTGEKLFELAGHTASVSALAYSSDGRQIATSSNDGTIRLWDADTGEPQITLQGIVALFLAFSPDDTRLAAQGADGILRLYATAVGGADGNCHFPPDALVESGGVPAVSAR
jgi:WD40 repeat protein